MAIPTRPMPPTPAAAARPTINRQVLRSVITRTQGTEFEQSLLWASNTQVSTATALRTDRKISMYYLKMRGRLTLTATPPVWRSGPSVLTTFQSGTVTTTPLYALFQYITLKGTNSRYGAQTPMYMRGESIAEMVSFFNPNYVPTYSVINSAGGTNGRFGVLTTTAAATIDFEIVLPIPLYVLGIASADVPFYSLHGPDWAGNLYMDIQCADGTVLTSTVAAVPTLSAFGSAAGTPTIEISSVRPLLTKTGQGTIQSVLCFSYTYYGGPTTVVQSTSGAGLVITNLQVGKDTARIWLKTGSLYANVSAGNVAFGSLSDQIITRSFPAMDNRPVRFNNPNSVALIADFQALSGGRTAPAGYQDIDFISTLGAESVANPKAAFPGSTLTADRLWQLQGDVSAAGNQACEVVQVMQVGAPGIVVG